VGPLRRSSNSVNLTTYKEGDERGQVWVEVLRNVRRTATGWDGPVFFSVRVNRQYGGEVGRFTYEPKTEPRGGARPGELPERTVTALVRRYLNEKEN
jgi:hypothetical protein